MSKAVITWGRLNPVTIGHEKLVNKVKSEAKKRGAMPHVYISHTQDKKKNPLDYNTKYNFARKAFGSVVTKSNAKTIIQVLQEVEKMGHNEVTVIVGSDRVSEFKTFTSKYNGKDYTFDKLEVISAGERDPDAEGVSGMSASKMRAVAQAGDYDSFKTGTPSRMSEKDKKAMYDKIRSVMGVNEEIEVDDSDFDISDQELDAFVEMIDLEKLDEESELDEEFETFLEEMELTERKPLSVSQRIAIGRRMKRLAPKLARKREIAKKKMADKPRLEKRARKAAITALRKKFAGDQGANYASLSPGAKISVDRVIQKKIALVGKLSQKMMPKIRKAEIERLKTVRDSQKEVGTANESFEVYLDEACWDGYKQVGMKKKGDKMVPDCVPEEIIFEDDDQMNTKLLYMLRQAFTNDIERQLIIRALKGGSKSLQNPKLRPFILKLLNRLLDATQQDPTMFNKMKDRLRRMSQADDKEVKEAEDPDIKDREGTQPAKYHAGLKKSTKAKRDSHFKKMADKPDDQKSAYKPAPGDARAETKPSKHTQKYKAMYGEDVDAAFESFITEEYIEEKALGGLKKKAEKSGISYGILKKVYDRGMAAWKTGHRPGTTPQQWAYARVNSFLTGGKTRTTADADLWKQAKGQKEEVEEARKSPLQRLKDFDKTRAAVGKKPIFKQNEKPTSKKEDKAQNKNSATESVDEAFEGFLEDEHKDCGTPECCGQCPTANTVSESLTEGFTAGISDTMFANEFEEHNVHGGFAYHPSVTEAGGAGEEGTTKLKKKYQDDTPGQTCEEEDWGCWCSEENLLESELQEAEYQGKKVTLNDPIRSSDGKKKFHVYVKNEKGNIIKLGFGDPNMEIKRDDPARRKSFRARHNCSDPGPKWKARYWSCYQWRGSAKVDN